MIIEVHTATDVWLPPGTEDDQRIMWACTWIIGFGEQVWARDWIYETHPTIPVKLVEASSEWVLL